MAIRLTWGLAVRVHIVGAGLIGRKRALALDQDDVVVSVTDLDVDRQATLQRELHELGRPVEGNPSPGPGDAAIIAVTHDQLTSAAHRFVESGCHLLLEKPGARSSIEFQDLMNVATADQVVGVGYNHRFHPAIQKLSRIAKERRFGGVRTIRARYGHGGRPGYESEWRMDRERSGGGELMDQGSHLIDLTRFIAGDFQLLHSELATLYWESDVEDNAWLIGALPAGGRASLHASWTEWKNLFSFEVFFETAKVEVFGLGGSYGQECLTVFHMESGLGIPTRADHFFSEQDLSWQHEWTDFKQRIRVGHGIGATGADAIAVLKAIGEAYSHAHH